MSDVESAADELERVVILLAQVFELLVQKNCMEHEMQRSAAAAAATVQQAVRCKHDAESATKHAKTRLDAAAAEIQALQAQVRSTLQCCSTHRVHLSNDDVVCSLQMERRGVLWRKLQLQLYAQSSTSKCECNAVDAMLCHRGSYPVADENARVVRQRHAGSRTRSQNVPARSLFFLAQITSSLQ
jgi:hypothetical protein